MNYYPFHIGDYSAHTARLSLIEDLAYRRMLDVYYLSERPFNGCSTDVAREIGMPEHIQAVEYILSKFFQKTETGYSNKRCNDEIARFNAKKEQASRAGKASGVQRAFNGRSTGATNNSTSVGKSATGVQPTITNNHNQEPKEEESPNGDRPPSADNCPHEKILGLFAKILPELTQPIRSRWAGSKGATQLRTRWREDKRHQDLNFWEWYFGIVKQNPFYLGQNDRGWKADLPWLLKRDNFDKMLTRGVSNGH